jgi:sugar-specific transcriptional regulator TrmB
MYEQFLIQSGLTKDQANVYQVLLKGGFMPARKVAISAGLKRGLAYKVLDDLVTLGLIEKNERISKIALFTCLHPSKILELVEKKQKEAKLAKNSIENIIGSLVSEYNFFSGKPNVRFFEGKDGLNKLYEDILFETQDIRLIRSPMDDDTLELKDLVASQIEKQVKKGIKTRVISPAKNMSLSHISQNDKNNSVTRCWVPWEQFNVPAQILIYGDKVGITSYKDNLFTTIIENKNIAETFKIFFEYTWKMSEKQSDELIEKSRIKE